jgi:hypothetical protein
MEYFQPLGSLFFIMPYFHFKNEYDTFGITEEIEFNILYRSLSGGIWTGMNFGKDAVLKAGYSYETVHSYSFESILTNYENASILHTALTFDSRPTTVFPFRGFYTLLYLQHADPAFGGSAYFWKISSDTELIIPLFSGFCAGMTLSLGTDLSGIMKDTQPLMTYRQFNLNSPFQFAGFEDWDVYGLHKASAGFDIYYKILPISPLLGGDLILLMNVSAGNCLSVLDSVESFYPLHWNITTGLGIHINNNFGLALRLTCADLSNFSVTFDMGAFDFSLEDIR